MTQDVKVNVTRILVILSAMGALIGVLAAFRWFGDSRYVTRDEFLELKSDVRVIKCAVRPGSEGCP